jgi:hypothetical protein
MEEVGSDGLYFVLICAFPFKSRCQKNSVDSNVDWNSVDFYPCVPQVVSMSTSRGHMPVDADEMGRSLSFLISVQLRSR